jgi:hypothetical protein
MGAQNSVHCKLLSTLQCMPAALPNPVLLLICEVAFSALCRFKLRHFCFCMGLLKAQIFAWRGLHASHAVDTPVMQH